MTILNFNTTKPWLDDTDEERDALTYAQGRIAVFPDHVERTVKSMIDALIADAEIITDKDKERMEAHLSDFIAGLRDDLVGGETMAGGL